MADAPLDTIKSPIESPSPTPQQNQPQQYNPTDMNRSVQLHQTPSQYQYIQPNQNVANPPRSKTSCCFKLKTALYIITALSLAAQMITCAFHSIILEHKYSHTYCVGLGCHNQGRYSSYSNLDALLTIVICSALDCAATVVFIISVAKTRKPLCCICFLIGLALKSITFASGLCYYHDSLNENGVTFVFSMMVLFTLTFASHLGYESILVYYFVVKPGPEITGVESQNPTQVYPETQTLDTPANTAQQYP